ncbi:MAG: hypothetical protein AB1485_08170 [Candidatus Thermoplasmatota archaeon]
MRKKRWIVEELCPHQKKVESPYLHYVCDNPRYLTEIGIDKPRMMGACKNWRNCPLLKKEAKRK